MRKFLQIKTVIIFCFLISISIGCEKIDDLRNSLSKNDSKVMQPTAQPKKIQQPKKAAPSIASNELARIGDWSITKAGFNERLQALKEVVPEYDINDPKSRRLVLDELIRQQLLVLDAEERGIANDKDISAAVEEFRRTLIVREVAAQLTKSVTFTEGEAKKFYEENKDKIREPEQWRIREIVVETQIEANELLVEVLKGADFAEIATVHSISESADKGGDLGYLEEEPFSEMVDELIKLKEGEVSGVFKGPGGFYIVKLDDIKGGKQILYEDIKDDLIKTRTIMKQQESILDYIKNLEEKIKVEINESLLN